MEGPSGGFFGSRTEATRDDWQTPIEYVRALGEFDLDPCANQHDPTRCARRAYTVEDDGLNLPWFGRVWCNPPYGSEARDWLEKLGQHGDGIALIPPRMGAQWFHNVVLARFDAMLFHYGRVAFINPETGLPVTGNNADSVFIAYGQRNVEALLASGIPGKVWVP